MKATGKSEYWQVSLPTVRPRSDLLCTTQVLMQNSWLQLNVHITPVLAAVVLCNFNHLHKTSRKMWTHWARILNSSQVCFVESYRKLSKVNFNVQASNISSHAFIRSCSQALQADPVKDEFSNHRAQDSILWTLNDSEETKSNIAAELKTLGKLSWLFTMCLFLIFTVSC